jgi:DNA invertase Pin-like site-specific DNA recombinase
MIAAIYARKSTDQSTVADEAKSVTRQVEHASTFAIEHGWAVDERFIFVDDGISGAEFENRPGFVRLMASLGSKRQKPPFQVLIMSEESRLGREQFEVGYALKQIVQAGVRLFFYLERRERTLNSPIEKAMLSLQAMSDEMEREKARQRALDVSFGKARAGHVTGGKVFGYDNLRVGGHVERRINEAEAAIVGRVFELAAAGHGSRHIAHLLNEQHVPTPRAQRGRPNGWDHGTIRAVLERPLYRGVIEYGKTRKRDTWGRKRITARAVSDLVRIEKPELRIIPEALTAEVDSIRGDRRERYLRSNDGRLLGRPVLRKYLLSGMLRCPCGANFEAQKSPHGMRTGLVYVCSAHRRKGAAICANGLALPIDETDDRVLGVIEGEVLTPAFIERVLDTVFVPDAVNRAALEAEGHELERQVVNLTTAVKAGGDIPALVEELKRTNARLVDVRRRLEPREHQDREQLRRALDQRVTEWRQVLRDNPAQGRQVLHHVIGPIMLWLGNAEDLAVADAADPRDRRGKENLTAADVRWTADTKTAGLLAGMGVVQQVASPQGMEDFYTLVGSALRRAA